MAFYSICALHSNCSPWDGEKEMQKFWPPFELFGIRHQCIIESVNRPACSQLSQTIAACFNFNLTGAKQKNVEIVEKSKVSAPRGA